DLAVVSAPRKGMMFERNVNDLGGVTLRPKNGAVFSVQEPAGILKRMLRESLSVAIHEPTSTVGVTNPEGDIVTFWHLLEGRFLGSLDVQGPRGIALTLDGQEFLVTHGKGRSLSFVSPETLEIVDTRELTDPVLTGSHIVVHNLPMG
ncbi:MAG: DUF1513 domain-containing protein, partial [Salinibacterium sp.]|nr:DUF1513 domain-containing protein [Salinibacterium sp.]